MIFQVITCVACGGAVGLDLLGEYWMFWSHRDNRLATIGITGYTLVALVLRSSLLRVYDLGRVFRVFWYLLKQVFGALGILNSEVIVGLCWTNNAAIRWRTTISPLNWKGFLTSRIQCVLAKGTIQKITCIWGGWSTAPPFELFEIPFQNHPKLKEWEVNIAIPKPPGLGDFILHANFALPKMALKTSSNIWVCP